MRAPFLIHFAVSSTLIGMMLGLPLSLIGQDLGVIGLYPPAAAPGETVVVTCRGKPAVWPVEVWSDRSGISASADEESGKITLNVSDDAAPGLYWLRLCGEQHVSKMLPFYLDRLPSQLEEEPNNRDSEATPLPVPSALTGRLEKSDDVDTYRITLTEGDHVTAALLAHRPFGSPMDAVIQICDANGNVIDQNDDERGLDPQLTFRASSDGDYLIRLFAFPETPNSSVRFAGAETFVYRLEVSQGDRFELPVGANDAVDDTQSGAASFIAEPMPDRNSIIHFSSELVGTVESTLPGSAPNQTLEQPAADVPQPLAIPSDVWGVVGADGERDEYEVELTKDQRIRVTVESRPFLLALDPYVQVLGVDGVQIGANDDFDKQRRSRVDVKAPVDGRYRIVVSDATGNGGERFGYRCRVEKVVPTFDLSLKTHSLQVVAGQSVSLEVDVSRRDGFDKPIQIQAIDLPEGVTCEPVTSEMGGDLEKKVTLTLAADSVFAGQVIRIHGQAGGAEPVVATFPTGIGEGRHTAMWFSSKAE